MSNTLNISTTTHLLQLARSFTFPHGNDDSDWKNCHQTTLARAIYKEIGGEKNAVYLTHDQYYKDISHLSFEERSNTNFDHPDSLDTMLLVEHVKDLKSGKTACVPNYDFTTHSRTPATTLVQPKRIIIVEGILLFTNVALCDEIDIKVFVVSIP